MKSSFFKFNFVVSVVSYTLQYLLNVFCQPPNPVNKNTLHCQAPKHILMYTFCNVYSILWSRIRNFESSLSSSHPVTFPLRTTCFAKNSNLQLWICYVFQISKMKVHSSQKANKKSKRTETWVYIRFSIYTADRNGTERKPEQSNHLHCVARYWASFYLNELYRWFA